MKIETILNAMNKARSVVEWDDNYRLKDDWRMRLKRRNRQRQAFRARILKMFEEKDEKLEMIEAGYDGLQYEMNKQLAEKDAEITKLKHDLAFINGQAASLSNTVADYASTINSLAHYIIDQPTSTTMDARDYANDALDFIIPHLESG